MIANQSLEWQLSDSLVTASCKCKTQQGAHPTPTITQMATAGRADRLEHQAEIPTINLLFPHIWKMKKNGGDDRKTK